MEINYIFKLCDNSSFILWKAGSKDRSDSKPHQEKKSDLDGGSYNTAATHCWVTCFVEADIYGKVSLIDSLLLVAQVQK